MMSHHSGHVSSTLARQKLSGIWEVSCITSDQVLLACRLIVFRAPRNFSMWREIINHTSICFRRFSRFSADLHRAWKRSASHWANSASAFLRFQVVCDPIDFVTERLSVGRQGGFDAIRDPTIVCLGFGLLVAFWAPSSPDWPS